MVGEHRKRGSGTNTTSVPKNYWWKRIHNLNTGSKLQDVSGSFNCAEKFSALVSCQRGYGSVAFYAFFSLFILTFLYVIWKIVCAHSRSVRRPGSGNSTTVSKLNPTTHAPTYHISTLSWLQNESVFGHSDQSTTNPPSFHNESSRENSNPAIFNSPVNEKHSTISSSNNINPPLTKYPWLKNHYPSWTSSEIPENPLYDFYPRVFNTDEPLLDNPNYPQEPYPTVYNSGLPAVQYPYVFNYHSHPPILHDYTDRRFKFQKPTSTRFPYNANSFGMSNERQVEMLPYSTKATPFRSPYVLPTYKNMQTKGFRDNRYHGDDSQQDSEVDVTTSPSPLITFFKDSTNNADNHRHQSKKKRRRRKKLAWRRRKEKGKKGNGVRHRWRQDYSKHNEKDNKRNLKRATFNRHHVVSNSGKSTKDSTQKHIDKSKQGKHHGTQLRLTYGIQQATSHQRRGISTRMHHHREKTNENKHYTARAKRKQHIQHLLPPKRAQINRRIEHKHVGLYHLKRLHLKVQHKSLRVGSLKGHKTSLKHVRKTRSRQIHHHRIRNVRVRHKHHSGHHKVLDFRQYRQYRKHHSIHDEVRGKWKVSRHRIRTCKLIDQFSTRGTVKMTRTKEKGRFVHTLLMCGFVKLRIRRYHRSKYSMRYAQICRKKWYLTKGIIVVDRRTNKQEIPRYKVRICKLSYVRSVKHLPANGKETRVWDISAMLAHKMEKQHRKELHDVSALTKHGHQHHHNNKNTKRHKKGKRKRNGKLLSRTFHQVMKRKRRKKLSKSKSHKYKLTIHKVRRSKLKGLQKKRKNHYGAKEKKFERKRKSKGKGKTDVKPSDEKFYRNLLKVLKLAKVYDMKKSNRTQSQVFDSLEAVLTKSQIRKKHSKQSKKKTEMDLRMNKTRKHPSKRIMAPKDKKKTNAKREYNIQALLAKLLPAVLRSMQNVTKAGNSMATTKAMTKPTLKVTSKTTRSTMKTTLTSQTPSTAKRKSNNYNIEDILKNILPLIVKKDQKANGDSLLDAQPRIKPEHYTVPSKHTTPRVTTNDLGLTNLLSRLDMGNLISNNLKITTVAKNRPLTRPSVIHNIPSRLPITKHKPSPAVPSPTSRQTDAVLQSPPDETSIETPTRLPTSPPGLPYDPISASEGRKVSASLKIPMEPSSLAQQTGSLSQGTSSSVSSFSSPGNSDPLSRNILCFGDSITSGFYNHGHSFHPYSQRLSQLLNSDGRIKYHFKTSGKVREMAHGSMARRLPQVLGNSSRFDWVIILGGTNDVAHVKNFGDDDSFMNQLISVWRPRIVRDIEVLHEIAHKYGARTLLLTIPETAYEAWPNFKTLWVMRRRINEDLRDYARRSKGSTVLCDLATEMPRHSLPLQTQNLLWADHLHLTPYGYDKMADIVYQCLRPYLRK